MEEFIDELSTPLQNVRITMVVGVCCVGVCSHTLVILVLLRKQVLRRSECHTQCTGAHAHHAAHGVHVHSRDHPTVRLHFLHVHLRQLGNALRHTSVDVCVHGVTAQFVSPMRQCSFPCIAQHALLSLKTQPCTRLPSTTSHTPNAVDLVSRFPLQSGASLSRLLGVCLGAGHVAHSIHDYHRQTTATTVQI
jgi:hypothetical protein